MENWSFKSYCLFSVIEKVLSTCKEQVVFPKHPADKKRFWVKGDPGLRLGFAVGLFRAMKTLILTVNF